MLPFTTIHETAKTLLDGEIFFGYDKRFDAVRYYRVPDR